MNFSIGEIAILQNCVSHPHLNGTEVTVIGELAQREVWDSVARTSYFADVYQIDIKVFEGITCVLPHKLRKTKPPETFSGEMRIIGMFTMQPVAA